MRPVQRRLLLTLGTLIIVIAVGAIALRLANSGSGRVITVTVPNGASGHFRAISGAGNPYRWNLSRDGTFILPDPAVFHQWHSYAAQYENGVPIRTMEAQPIREGLFVLENGMRSEVFIGQASEASRKGFRVAP